MRWFRDESTSVAATGLIVLTTGFSTQDQVLLDRLFDTSIGILVGLAVNMVVWPPLRDYSAARAIDSVDDDIAELLRDIAGALRESCTQEQVAEWVERTRDLDHDIDHAYALLRQARESSRLNPRRAAQSVKKTDVYESILRDNEQAVAELAEHGPHARSTASRASSSGTHEFRDRWIDAARRRPVTRSACRTPCG